MVRDAFGTDASDVNAAVKIGVFSVNIRATRPFVEVAKALSDLESRRATGTIILTLVQGIQVGGEEMATAQLIHFVGSVPLDDPEEVLRVIGTSVGGHICRIPDGETGVRKDWIRCIQQMLATHPDMEVDPTTPPIQWRQWDGLVLREIPQMRFKPGVDPAQVRYQTPYVEDATTSFALFDKLQKAGTIPAGVKFQVCIPTPLAPGYNYVAPGARSGFIKGFGDHIVGVVEEIARRIPADRLAIQWDVCQEVLMWEGYYDVRPANYKEEIWEVLGRVGNAVPAPVELGYHLCYGSPKDEHLIQPKDAGNMVEMANGIFAAVRRPIQFLHMPVPKNRADAAYFEPLKGLKLPKGTALYLGLVHFDDTAGDDARLAMARRYVHVDGVSTECGWGRADPHRVPGYLDSLRRAAEELS